MPLTSGTVVGGYVVQSTLGAGGMGEVYRARDTRLQRDVALKVLPTAVARDPERLARFAREAQVLARLNHAHIAQVHGLEHADGTPALVMELVEGPTLDEHIRARGPLPTEEATNIARQIADALEAAHECGVVHRDLKPANVKLRADDVVKVLDFGLAKAIEPVSAQSHSGDILSSPTIAGPAMTTHGMILGTAAYMAPEQARGKPVDKRADIWAFGCVLFEMLAGRRAFAGESVTDTIAAVITMEPDWSALPPATPPRVREVLARCLAKDPRSRFRDIGDVRYELERGDTIEGSGRSPIANSWLTRIPWVIAIAAVAAAAGVAYRARTQPAAESDLRPMRFIVPAPANGGLEIPGSVRAAGAIKVSPDGRRLAMLATTSGGRIWVQDLSSTEPRLVPGTSGAQQPFWSPDGRSLGFFSVRTIRKLDLESGAIQDIGPKLGGVRGGSLAPDGTVLFKDDSRPGISRLSPGTKTPTTATELDAARGDRGHWWPLFLPDGRRFLLSVDTGKPETTGIYVGELGSTAIRFITNAHSNAEIGGGRLLFVRDGTLFAQPFAVETAEVTGEASALDVRVNYNPSTGHSDFSVSWNGVLAHASTALDQTRLAWFDRTGQKYAEVEAQSHMDISPDGRHVAADRIDPQTATRDVWVFSVDRGQRTRLSFSSADDWVPTYSPDGTSIVYASDRDSPGVGQLYQKAATGGGAESLLLRTDGHKHHTDWSPDGRFLVYEENGAHGLQDLWILPMSGERKPFVFLEGPFRKAQPSFSPDSKLIAYAANDSGVFEVYVQNFPASGGKWQVSTDGGTNPQWRRDGKEMYYLSADGRIMALDVDLAAPSFGTPRPLFQTAIAGDSTTDHFAVTADGQRFLMHEATRNPGFMIVLNALQRIW